MKTTDNLADALSLGPGAGTLYAASTTRILSIEVDKQENQGFFNLNAVDIGVAGNSITTIANTLNNNMFFGSSTFTGGTDGTGAGGLVALVTLPATYVDRRYLYVEVFDSNTWFPVYVSTTLLSGALFTSAHSIYGNGTITLTFDPTTRALETGDQTQKIARVALIDIG